ncbi:hypothetical protein GNI_235080, partial [Gregarina niphandrodes]
MAPRCPRLDLIGEQPHLNDFRTRVLKLQKYVSYDHVFAAYRNDEETGWFMKTKPLKNPQRTELEKALSLQHILQNNDATKRRQKLKPKDYDHLANAVSRALPIPDVLAKKN